LWCYKLALFLAPDSINFLVLCKRDLKGWLLVEIQAI
jgi:hypothetical protein